ncbi:MAG: cob(I)yrinic acid a,c-diamide adenosyltransferase [Candidatus Sungbacteria bacterium]|nr:cob(I)yrinic acid a,c-diamide adenosyltransferase [Candidatus Sungbacteria bacterium]
MLYIFTGNGKGKTTAALGQAVRAVGEGKKVLMVQFIKGPWKSGEDDVEVTQKGVILSEAKNPRDPSVASLPQDDKRGIFKLVKMGKGFVGIMGDKLPREEHEKAAEEALEYARKEIEAGNWDIVILDEINNAISLGLVAKDKVLELLKLKPDNLHLIFTGRDAPQEFIDRADLVTEMRDSKHPYNKGVKGKRGLEY